MMGRLEMPLFLMFIGGGTATGTATTRATISDKPAQLLNTLQHSLVGLDIY